jgi:hypothetical protein
MRCEDAQAQLPDHLTRALPLAAANALDAHLQTCPSCAAELDAAADTWQRMAIIPSPAADSTAMRARFHAMLDEHVAVADSPARRRVSVTHYGLQFAAAAALVVLGVALGRQTTPAAAPDPQIADMRAELRDMREMVTLSLLQQQSASERLRGVSYTDRIDQPGNELTRVLLDALMHDPNDNVRLRTVDALKRFADHETVRRGAVEALSQQTSPLVQVALIDFVVEMNSREAADALRQLSADSMIHEQVRARAEQGLARLGA